jgi:ABC-type bacteriocin/lantibiotic exporter with double-glycine peptidase domain
MPCRFSCVVTSVVGWCVSAIALAAGPAGLWLDVPFVPQQNEGCGAASIAMVMQYWQKHNGRPVLPQADASHILRALYSGPAHGIYASAMVRYFNQNGYRAIAFPGEPEDLARELQLGRPLIAALRPGAGSPLHYVVVAGIDQPHQLVLVNDPAQRKLLKEDQSQFEHEWDASDRWLLLAVPQAGSH